MALAYREVLEQVTAVSHRTVSIIHVVGGGSQNALLNQMTADAAGLPVVAGPVEATVMGNALVQLITLGEISDWAQARQIVAGLGEMKRYEPGNRAAWDEIYGRYQSLVHNRTNK
ncbi:MAG: hypothetical protein KDE56_25665 [Anaerolineales bacterium]|nr:hypothetical protein [Anaerolineales bacterium]